MSEKNLNPQEELGRFGIVGYVYSQAILEVLISNNIISREQLSKKINEILSDPDYLGKESEFRNGLMEAFKNGLGKLDL